MATLSPIKITGIKSGPTIFLTAGLHGDEPGAVAAARKIVRHFQKNPLLRGALYVMPTINAWGLKNKNRFFNKNKEDLNRCFPGSPNGSPAQKAAWKIFQEIILTKPDLIVDLHNDWPESIPYLVLENPKIFPNKKNYSKTAKIARTAGLIIVQEKNTPKEIRIARRTLSGSLAAKNHKAFVLELGEYKKINKNNIRVGIQTIKNILIGLKMISGRNKKSSPKIFSYNDEPKAPTAGTISFFIKAGQKVKSGQKFGEIKKSNGQTKELFIKNKAIVLSLIDKKTAKTNEEIIALAEF